MKKLSARNQLKGKIIEVKKGTTTSHIRIDIGNGIVITSAITNEAVADLNLKAGDEAWAVIKASDVMIEQAATVSDSGGRAVYGASVEKLTGHAAFLPG
jgi:molybdopterin-binding protein